MLHATLKGDKTRFAFACVNTLFAVSAMFITQSIFLELSQSFQINITEARYSFSIVSLFYAASFFILGPAVDKFELPKIAFTGLILLALSILGASYAPGFGLFMAAMAFTGFCAALIPASMFPYVTKVSPPGKIGLNVGLVVASATLGVIFGRVVVGVLTSVLGWRVSFKLYAVSILIMAVFTFVSMVEGKARGDNNSPPLMKLYLNSLKLLISPRILSLFLAGLTLFFGFLGMVTFLTYRLVAPPFNFSSGEVGWISFAGITAIIAPFSGSLSQKIGIHRIIFPSLVICLVAFQILGWFQSVSLILLALLLIFLGVYACHPLVFLLIGKHAPKESGGSASALYILFCVWGGSLSSMVLGPVWQSYGWPGITVTCTLSMLACLAIMLANAWLDRIQPVQDKL